MCSQHYIEPRTTFHDVVHVLNSVKELRPRTRVYTFANGTSALLLCIYGKILDVPILLWLPKEYPSIPCMIYIDLELIPSSVKPAVNQCIDSNGRIYLPILSQWSENRKELLDVVKELTHMLRSYNPLFENSSGSIVPLPPKPWERVSLSSTESGIQPSDDKREGKSLVSSDRLMGSDSLYQKHIPPPIPAKPFRAEVISPNIATISNKHRPMVPNRPPLEDQPDILVKEQCSDTKSYFKRDEKTTHKSNLHVESESNSLIGHPESLDFLTNLMDMTLDTSSDGLHTQLLSRLQEILRHLTVQDSREVENYVASSKFDAESILSRLDSHITYEISVLDEMEEDIKKNSLLFMKEIDQVNKELAKVAAFKEDIDPANIAVPETASLVQLYELVAKDKALKDAIDMLSQLFHKNRLSSNFMVKKTRELSSEQFRVRYLIFKIASLLE